MFETTGNTVSCREESDLGFGQRTFLLVNLVCMQMRAATSDPELERHFFLNRGRKGQKLDQNQLRSRNLTFNIRLDLSYSGASREGRLLG